MDAKKQEVGELTKWIRLLHSENDEERAEAWDRVINAYWQSLTLQIRKKLQGTAKHRAGESDLYQDVWLVFVERSYEATDSESLRALLRSIVQSTVINSWKYHSRLKRSTELEVGFSNNSDNSSLLEMDRIVAQPRLPAERFNPRELRCDLPASEALSDDSFIGDSLALLTAAATPSDAAVAMDVFNLLLSLLKKKADLEIILRMSLKGHTSEEIAQSLGSTNATVKRKLLLIRKRFEKYQGRSKK